MLTLQGRPRHIHFKRKQMTSSVSADQYYKNHISEEDTYVNIYTARPVKAGDTTLVGFFEATVEKDSYEVTQFTGNDNSSEIVSRSDFARHFTDASAYLPATKQRVLSQKDQASVTHVKRGDRLAGGLIRVMNDGVLIEQDAEEVYMSNFELVSKFKNASTLVRGSTPMIVARKDETPRKGIILKEAVTFVFKDGNFSATPGSFLYINPEDKDGYTVISGGNFAALALRKTPGGKL